MKKIIRLTEHDLFKIVKRVINEQGEPPLIRYQINPEIQGIKPLYVLGDPINKKIYTDDGTMTEIGFKSSDDFVKNWINNGDGNGGGVLTGIDWNPIEYFNPKYNAGFNYMSSYYNLNLPIEDGPDKQGTVRMYFSDMVHERGCNVYGFCWEKGYYDEGEVPIVVGIVVGKTKKTRREGKHKMFRVGNTMCKTTAKLVKYKPTPPPPPDVPREITLDLKNMFYYDCPEMPGCGQRGGTDEDPLKSKDAYADIDVFTDTISQYYTDTKPIYVLGFASLDGSTQHNLELSQRRASFVASRIANRLKNKNIRIIPRGMGETDVFKRGDTEADYEKNRRIIVTLDPSSTTPYMFKFTE